MVEVYDILRRFSQKPTVPWPSLQSCLLIERGRAFFATILLDIEDLAALPEETTANDGRRHGLAYS